MRLFRLTIVATLLFSFTSQFARPTKACGPSYVQPIFVFENSPDLPFRDFTAGKIGIVKPTFGRKTLLIAYRYLNGGSFDATEQEQLVHALKGEGPESDGDEALKAWVALRKQMTPEEELPEIYRDRKTPFARFDYFPNCSSNAFEVATATLKDRVASYGADDRGVHEWLHGQDEVFQNCAGGSATIPRELGAESPMWLRKDRDYQIAAALFYSLQFDDAIARFEKIAADGESSWQTIADYLVARALVRQASLTDDPSKKSAVYAKAENQTARLISGNNQFRDAARKLQALVKYRIHPEERVMELADAVSRPGASLDLRQDVIDYVWLLDKFEAAVLEKEHERQEALKKKEKGQSLEPSPKSVYDQVQRGDLISITFMPKFADGSTDYHNLISLHLKPDTPETEILRLAAERLNRDLTEEESKALKDQINTVLNYQRWATSYNLKVSRNATEYEGCYRCYELKLTYPQMPSFLLNNDLTDWIFTLQLDGPETYEHAFNKWHESDSPAWLVAALVKAEAGAPHLNSLMEAASRVAPDSAAFATIAFHLIRLQRALGQTSQAQRLLETVVAQFDQMPLSAQNEFQAQRLRVARNLTQFLSYAARKPAAFFEESIYASIRELIESRKADYEEDESDIPKAEIEQRLEREYQDLLSDDLKLLDERTAEVVDRHFSLRLLQQAATDPQNSTYLRNRFSVALWTRGLLLGDRQVATQFAPTIVKISPEIAPLVKDYLAADNPSDQEHAALYLMLKSPGLTPFISANLPQTSVNEDVDYYFESAWWCVPSETEYRDGQEVKKVVNAPPFIEPQELAAAKQEYDRLVALGDAKSYLGKRVLAWAHESPEDPRIPEALFIAFKANEDYKYGCGGWEHNDEIRNEAQAILRERYPTSGWTAKLSDTNDR